MNDVSHIGHFWENGDNFHCCGPHVGPMSARGYADLTLNVLRVVVGLAPGADMSQQGPPQHYVHAWTCWFLVFDCPFLVVLAPSADMSQQGQPQQFVHVWT